MNPFFLLLFAAQIVFYTTSAQNPDPTRQWFMYRGNYASGVLDNTNLSENWNVETGENILWKTEISGLGLSYPIIWGILFRLWRQME